MERTEYFISLMNVGLADELLAGSKILVSYLAGQKEDRQFVLIERPTPRKDKDGREFLFAQYYVSRFADIPQFYLGTEYVKMRRDAVIKRAYARE